MKKFALPLALVGAVVLQACNQQGTGGGEAAQQTQAPSAPALDTPEQRLSYGIAYSLGQRMAAEGLPLDSDAFQLGVTDALAGAEARLTAEEMQAEMQAYQQQAMAKQQEAQAALAEANAAAAAAFLEQNAAREGVVTTESGLQYEVLEAGDGPMPGPEDTVEVHYRGTLVDGTEFDSSYNRGQPVTFGVGQVIPGWTEALQLMPVGSKWKLAIPSDLAYGSGGAGQVIGPDAALVFEVELLSIPSQAGTDAEEEAAAEG
ncbi:MAG: hypothetical protein CME59_00225 [Halioglobus sp.]|nr:hypothetical protein [Halioglobus sp.]|tara:strand:+ start:595 stop:1374 length:780 start_codon:yes stop_codon:yes gene_type:complete